MSKIINGKEYFISEKRGKKLKVKVNNRWVHFGDSSYQHFYDKTGLLDDSYNHFDDKRRQRYLKRASKILDRDGNKTMYDENSPNYYAIRILW